MDRLAAARRKPIGCFSSDELTGGTLSRTGRDCHLAANGWSWRDIDVLAKVPLPQGERQSRVFYMIDNIPPASQCQGFACPSGASATICGRGGSIVRPRILKTRIIVQV
jgi:hypothetical protein